MRYNSLKIVNEIIDAFIYNEINYVILRNYEMLPDEYSGRDLDLLMNRSQIKKIDRILTHLFKKIGYKILQRVDKVNIVSYRIFKIDNDLELFTIDIFWYIGFRNNILINSNKIIDSSIKHSNKYHIPNPEMSAYSTILHHFLYTGYVKKKKYIEEFKQNIDQDKFINDFNFIFGDKYLINLYNIVSEHQRISKSMKIKLRNKLMYFNIKSDLLLWINRTICMLKKEAYYFFCPDGISINISNEHTMEEVNHYKYKLQIFDVRNDFYDISKFSFFKKCFFKMILYYKRVRHNIYLVKDKNKNYHNNLSKHINQIFSKKCL